MQWFYNMKIAKKLILSFFFMAVIAGIIAYIGILNIKKIDKSDTELYENITVPISQLGDIGVAFHRIRVNTRDIIQADTDAQKNEYASRITKYRGQIDSISTEYEKRILSDAMKNAFDDFKDTRKA